MLTRQEILDLIEVSKVKNPRLVSLRQSSQFHYEHLEFEKSNPDFTKLPLNDFFVQTFVPLSFVAIVDEFQQGIMLDQLCRIFRIDGKLYVSLYQRLSGTGKYHYLLTIHFKPSSLSTPERIMVQTSKRAFLPLFKTRFGFHDYGYNAWMVACAILNAFHKQEREIKEIEKTKAVKKPEASPMHEERRDEIRVIDKTKPVTKVLEPTPKKRGSGKGSHLPPREHDRIGHWYVRNGEKFWRNGCTVNLGSSRGRLEKDYKLNGFKGTDMSVPNLTESKILYLKEVMKKEGMSIKDLSIKLEVTEAWIKMLLKGDQNISRFILQKLHKLSGLSFETFRLKLDKIEPCV